MRAAVALATLVLALPAPAAAARFAVGVRDSASVDRVAAELARATGSVPSRHLVSLGALVVDARGAAALARLPGVDYVERMQATRRLAFTPNDPLAPRQWYLAADRAYDFWADVPTLPGVRVAVIDSGVDGGHPELAGRIALSASFVGGSPLTDQQGHGTFVAGEIAAETGNAAGIAGIAFPAQLLIAKVTRPDGTISLEAEAAAIRWAADHGARVINLSLGGLRDPLDPERDTYSPLEAAAVEYASSKGALLVAAVGNADQSPATPWSYAWYPAALPHVVGVSAYSRDGSVPAFSNRDAIYNDLAAPGEEMLSTFPRQLTAQRPLCVDQGYSDCASDEYRHADGTSFSAPQVSGAAGLLLSVEPQLQSDQLAALLERNAADANAATGCRKCPLLRDSLSGWGRLDVTRALQAATSAPLPVPDRYEPNDDAGARAQSIYVARGAINATIDFWDDQLDVYRLSLKRGETLTATVQGPVRTRTGLVLWKPGTTTVEGLSADRSRTLAARSTRRGTAERVSYKAATGGFYYLEVRVSTPGSGAYSVRFAKTRR